MVSRERERERESERESVLLLTTKDIETKTMWKQSTNDTKNGKKEVSLPEAAVMGSTAVGCKLLLSSGRLS